MRAALAAAALVAALLAPGCLSAQLADPAGEALSPGDGNVASRADVHRHSAVVPLWVGVLGSRAHPDGAEQFRFDPDPGFHAVVVEARWDSRGPDPVNRHLKLLFLGHDRAILGEAEGPSPLRLQLPASQVPAGPYVAYAVGAEDAVGVTKDQPYDLAVSFLYGEAGPADAFSGF